MNLTISKKLFAGCGGLSAIALLIGGTAIYNVTSLGNAVQDIGHHYVHNMSLAGDVNSLSADLLSVSRGMLLQAYMNDNSSSRQSESRFGDDMTRIKRVAEELSENTSNPQLHQVIQSEILNKLDEFQAENSTMYELSAKGDLNGASQILRQKVLPVATGVNDAGNQILQLESQTASARADDAIGAVGPARNLSIFMIFLSLGVAGVVIYVVRGINKTLAESATELREAAGQVASAASQVSSSSQSLAQGASEQAASLEETSASSEEINSMARKNTDNSKATAELLAQSQEKVELANRHLADMVLSMNEITESSGKISKIIKVIDEIAFQTNILALNAAVEAARAGEAGMGFAVVADEVRSLAQRSAQAAKDTATLIEDSISKSSEGKGKVDQVASAIHAVTEDTARIKVMVDEVSLSSEEQSKGMEQIGKAIVQMEQVTQTTAANAEEGAAAAQQLNAQSETMKDVIMRLFAMINDGAAADIRTTPRMVRSMARPPAGAASRLAKAPSQPASSAVQRMRQPQPARESKMSVPDMGDFPLEESFRSF
jgi:methyl-accepting chemotaxis protein/methyl-accepting chemotaxis protein-1 (serine sensor receptor)